MAERGRAPVGRVNRGWQGTNTATGADWPGAVPSVKPTPPSRPPAAPISPTANPYYPAGFVPDAFSIDARPDPRNVPMNPDVGSPGNNLRTDREALLEEGLRGRYNVNDPTPVQAGDPVQDWVRAVIEGGGTQPGDPRYDAANRALDSTIGPLMGFGRLDALGDWYTKHFDPNFERTVGEFITDSPADRFDLPGQAGFQGGRGGAGSGGVGPAINTGVTPLPTDSRGVTPMPTIVGGGGPGAVDGSGMGKTTPSFEELLEAARTGAITEGQRTARQRGLDPLDYTDLFTGEAQRIGETIPVPTSDAPTDFSTYFTPDFGPSTLAGEQARLRDVYGRDVSAFTPSGFERGYFGSSFGDPTIQSILAERREPAERFITSAAARGLLDPRGQEAARRALGRQESVGRAALGTERDILTERYRGGLTDIGREAAEGAAGFTLGSAFDPQSFSNRISEAAARSGEQFEGELRGAAGPQGTYFRPQEALRAGGLGQGPQNLGAGGGIQNVLAARRTGGRDTRRGYGQRGLGTTGAF